MDKNKDVMRFNFDKALKEIGVTNQPKNLIDENGNLPNEFTANGNKYVIAPPSKVFNFDRQIAYLNFETAFSLNKTPTEIYQAFVKLLQNQIRLMSDNGKEWADIQQENLRDCMNFVDSMRGEDHKRLPPAYWMCTLFIIKEGEDLSSWDWKMGLNKIQDWSKENLNPIDFFSLALHFSKSSMETIKNELKAT